MGGIEMEGNGAGATGGLEGVGARKVAEERQDSRERRKVGCSGTEKRPEAHHSRLIGRVQFKVKNVRTSSQPFSLPGKN